MAGFPNLTLRRVVLLKTSIACGILAPHFLPPHWALGVASTANLLWLFSD